MKKTALRKMCIRDSPCRAGFQSDRRCGMFRHHVCDCLQKTGKKRRMICFWLQNSRNSSKLIINRNSLKKSEKEEKVLKKNQMCIRDSVRTL